MYELSCWILKFESLSLIVAVHYTIVTDDINGHYRILMSNPTACLMPITTKR